MKRNNAIELCRIYASILLVILHLEEFFGTGAEHFSNIISIYVEFFLMVSGFFMMMHLDRCTDETETVWSYLFHKIKSFWAPLCIVNFVQLFIHCQMSHVNGVTGVLQKIWHFKWEFLLLQCAGFIQNPTFNQDYLVGPAWYLSALVISTAIAYPLAKHFRRTFTDIVCPLAILLIYCSFSQAYGSINVGNDFLFPVMDAVLRAFAGICCGALSYRAYSILKQKNMPANTTMIILDGAAWIMLPVSVLIAVYGQDDNALFMIIPFGIIIVSSMLNKTPVSRMLDNVPAAAASFLGKFSLYVYMAHWNVIFAVMLYIPQAGGQIKIITAFIVTLVYAFVLYLIDKKRKSMKPVYIICMVALLLSILL